MKLHEERSMKVDVIHLGAFLIKSIGRGKGDGSMVDPTPVPLGMERVHALCACFHLVVNLTLRCG